MADNVVGKIKDALEGILSDRKTLIKIFSVVLILLAFFTQAAQDTMRLI